jgi:hypothetical protein
MSDDGEASNTKGIIDATTGLVKAVPIYDDLIQPAAKELGVALGTIAKTVNVALSPISGVIWSYETIKDFVSIQVSQKLEGVPPENIETPNPMVAGPALDALKYAGHEEMLRNMYANLLANALDKETKNSAHPSFVEVIKQISPGEASLLLLVSQRSEYPEICSYFYQQSIRGGLGGYGGKGVTSHQVTREFRDLCRGLDVDINTSAALDNFRRLQIFDIESTTSHKIEDSFFGRNSNGMSENLELKVHHVEKLHFTQYGIQFVNTCVKDKT